MFKSSIHVIGLQHFVCLSSWFSVCFSPLYCRTRPFHRLFSLFSSRPFPFLFLYSFNLFSTSSVRLASTRAIERHIHVPCQDLRDNLPQHFKRELDSWNFPKRRWYIIHVGVWERCQRVRRLKKCKSGLFTGRETHAFFLLLFCDFLASRSGREGWIKKPPACPAVMHE